MPLLPRLLKPLRTGEATHGTFTCWGPYHSRKGGVDSPPPPSLAVDLSRNGWHPLSFLVDVFQIVGPPSPKKPVNGGQEKKSLLQPPLPSRRVTPAPGMGAGLISSMESIKQHVPLQFQDSLLLICLSRLCFPGFKITIFSL